MTKPALTLLAATAAVATLALVQAYSFETPADPTLAKVGAFVHALNLTTTFSVLYVGLFYLQLRAILRQHQAQEKATHEQLNLLKG